MQRSQVPIRDRRLAVFLSGLLVVFLCIVIPAALSALKPPQVAVFEQVWQTVRDNFYDPNFNGADWKNIRQKYQPQVANVASEAQLAEVINQMLAELKASHTHFYTSAEPAYYELAGIFKLQQQLKPFLPNGKLEYTGIGAVTQRSDGKTFIKAILDGSPAAQAGLQVGDQILSVNDQPFQPIQSFVNQADRAVQVRIQRTADPTSGQTISVTPQRFDPARMFVDAMNASAQVIEQAGKRIGYIHVWSYADRIYQDQLEEQLFEEKLKNTDGLIWDLRDGWGGASPEYLNLFTAPVPEVTFIGRDGQPNRYDVQWKKPVVMLVNEGSRSGKEILAYGFRKYRVGTIVGSKTAGAVLAGRAFVMKDGSLLYLAVADVKVDGQRLEGEGVTPDVEVPRTIEYAQGSDPQKERAIQVVTTAVRP